MKTNEVKTIFGFIIENSSHLVTCLPTYIDVPVEVIANFNKMKSFTEDRTLIIKAMKNSSLLEVI